MFSTDYHFLRLIILTHTQLLCQIWCALLTHPVVFLQLSQQVHQYRMFKLLKIITQVLLTPMAWGDCSCHAKFIYLAYSPIDHQNHQLLSDSLYPTNVWRWVGGMIELKCLCARRNPQNRSYWNGSSVASVSIWGFLKMGSANPNHWVNFLIWKWRLTAALGECLAWHVLANSC